MTWVGMIPRSGWLLYRGLPRLWLVILVQDHEARLRIAFVVRTRHAPGIGVVVEEEHAKRPARLRGQIDAIRVRFHFLVVKADMERAIGRFEFVALHLHDVDLGEIGVAVSALFGFL